MPDGVGEGGKTKEVVGHGGDIVVVPHLVGLHQDGLGAHREGRVDVTPETVPDHDRPSRVEDAEMAKGLPEAGGGFQVDDEDQDISAHLVMDYRAYGGGGCNELATRLLSEDFDGRPIQFDGIYYRLPSGVEEGHTEVLISSQDGHLNILIGLYPYDGRFWKWEGPMEQENFILYTARLSIPIILK